MKRKQIIEIIGLLIAILACVAGWLAIPQIQGFFQNLSIPGHEPTQQPTAIPTYTSYPTYTPYPTEEVASPTPAVNVVTPTALPVNVVPTEVPSPAPTISLDTPANAKLSEGQFWRVDGIGLVLLNHVFSLQQDKQCAAFSFDMTNTSDNDLIVPIVPEQFSATDNTGRVWTTTTLSHMYWCPGSVDASQSTIQVSSGKTYTGGSNMWIISFTGPINDPQVTSLTIVVNGLSRFTGATWLIPIGR